MRDKGGNKSPNCTAAGLSVTHGWPTSFNFLTVCGISPTASNTNGKQHQREDTEPAPDPVTLEPSDDRVEEVGDAEGDDEGYERTLQHEEKAEEHGEGRRHHDPDPDGPVDERPVVARPGGRACTHAE